MSISKRTFLAALAATTVSLAVPAIAATQPSLVCINSPEKAFRSELHDFAVKNQKLAVQNPVLYVYLRQQRIDQVGRDLIKQGAVYDYASVADTVPTVDVVFKPTPKSSFVYMQVKDTNGL